MKILLSTLVIISGLNGEMDKDKIQSAVINGMYEGITGITKETINIATNPNKVIKNVKIYQEEKEEAQLKFYKKQYEERGKYILKMNEHRNEYLKKYNDLLKENKRLKAIIKKYNMNHENEKTDETIKKEEAIKKMRMNWKSN